MSDQKKIVILCEAYGSVDYPLHLIEHEPEDTRLVIFVTSMKDLHRFFVALNEKVLGQRLEIIYYPAFTPVYTAHRGIKRLWHIVADIFRERRYLKRFYTAHFKGMKGARIVFSSPAYNGAKIYTLDRLRKHNTLIFKDTGPPYIGVYSPRSIRDVMRLLIYKSTYGIGCRLGQFPETDAWTKGFPMGPRYLMRTGVAHVIDWTDRRKMMAGFPWEKYRVFGSGHHKVLYFHHDLVDRDVPDRALFVRELHDIFEVVKRHYPEGEIARKYHPGQELNRDVVTVGDELPAYVPAEFFYSDAVDVYLSISSLAIANVRGGGKAIALVNLITFNTEKLRDQVRDFIAGAGRQEILIPRTMDELDEMLAAIRRARA